MESSHKVGPHILNTQRLLLRPPEMSDVPAMHQLANDPEVAANLADMPHPYPFEAAAAVVSAMETLSAQGEAYAFVIVPPSESLIGVVYLILDSANQRAELIYWIGQVFWGHGYATEAVQAVIAFAFDTLKLRRVHASVFAQNTASVRVLQKCGLHYEGTLRQHLIKDGQFMDLLCYGLLRDEFESAPA